MDEALNKVKLALRITTALFDTQLTDLMSAALLDLGLAGADGSGVVISDPLVLQAVITYCRLNFGEPEDWERIKKAYDEQKAQLATATGYTVWSAEG
jgi:hypothetical protein